MTLTALLILLVALGIVRVVQIERGMRDLRDGPSDHPPDVRRSCACALRSDFARRLNVKCIACTMHERAKKNGQYKRPTSATVEKWEP